MLAYSPARSLTGLRTDLVDGAGCAAVAEVLDRFSALLDREDHENRPTRIILVTKDC